MNPFEMEARRQSLEEAAAGGFYAEARTAKVVLADFLDEFYPQEVDLAHAWRWAGARGFHPRVSPARVSICWVRASAHSKPGGCMLPRDIFDYLPRKSTERTVCRVPGGGMRGLLAAFEFLAVALRRHLDAYLASPPLEDPPEAVQEGQPLVFVLKAE